MDAPRPADAPRLYDEFAERFERHAATALWNAHYDRPAVLGLVGDVDGAVVLDAGCGPGFYIEELLARGAEVIGFDASAEMVRLAQQRAGDRAVVHHHRLGEPLTFVDDATVDVVVSALVWHYVDDRLGALREFHRVLREGGRVVISSGHPTDDWLRDGGSYFEVRHKAEYWSSLDATFASWHLPLTVLCDEFAGAGFVIERLLEPRPTPEARATDPGDYERLMTRPGFIVFRLRRD
jgi:SAM-dependent methyltransferase